ncbi:TetR/AcrR family transcriptional regulator [Nocardia stercoris]|uniref:TetR/AcrR family transcriptional regulator n=1 Tax=Nocardia stercoris TaxID=2483361 RepID=A0A3M2L9V1_9NOCA|nr:TetR/AcrR family transcriptional regulator [Nocardia stercoris]RMI34347.1 TetR/AcrR family transcriptional regulator [Nocardia stercoris]
MASKSAVPPRQRARHLGPERRRPQVLDAALRIAVEHGIGAVTVAAVADSLQVTRPVVYSCFADRVELLDALLTREENYLIDSAFVVLPRRRVEADEQVFVEGFQTLLTTVAARPDSWRLIYGNPDPALADRFGRGRTMAVDLCTRRLRPTLAAWGTADAERKLPAMVEQWVSAGEGAVRTLLAEPQVWTPEDLGAFVGAATYRALRGA